MEINKIDEIIILSDGAREIERYDFSSEINFSGLLKELIGRDFSSKITLMDKIENKTEQENNLVTFIQRIISDYNKKVELFLAETSDTSTNIE